MSLSQTLSERLVTTAGQSIRGSELLVPLGNLRSELGKAVINDVTYFGAAGSRTAGFPLPYRMVLQVSLEAGEP